MSGFDDLLQQSSRALEENPFEDPFSRPRSNSPDPWSSYTHQSASISSPAFEYDASGFGGVSTTTTTQAVGLHDDSFSPSAVESHTDVVPTTLSDPLDSANLPADDEPQPPARTSEPVLEADLPRTASLTLPSLEGSPTLQLSSPVTPSSAIPTELGGNPGPPSPPVPSSARLPQRQEALHPSAQHSFDASSPTVSDSQRIISSPLDQPPVTAFASLALGGESFNGFDGTQSAFVGNTPFASSAQEEEDDDDDKPLLPRPVSTSLYGSGRVRNSWMFLIRLHPQRRRKKGYNPCSQLASKIHRRSETLSARLHCTQFTPRYVLSEANIGCPQPFFQTTSPAFSKPSFSVLRRYSDFLWLYGTLSTNNPGVVVPPVPEKSPFGRFDDQFVRQRRTALENCINKIANHPVLCKDADLKLFLESDTFSLDVCIDNPHRKDIYLSSDRSNIVKRRLPTNEGA
jgi:sorting nexin-1/2